MIPKSPQYFFFLAVFAAARPAVGFTALVGVVGTSSSSSSSSRTTSSTTSTALPLSAVSSTQDDILKPAYDIEPIPIRIGHGFDIHRMAPLEEAGQPVVIGGVEIPHKDQKVRQQTTRKLTVVGS